MSAPEFAYELHDPLITVDNLKLRFGEHQVLDGVSFQVKNTVRPGKQQGQIVALLGPSGIGKTQCFFAISGLRQRDAAWDLHGDVRVGLDQKPVEAGQVGVVMQHYPLFEHLDVLENLVVGAVKSEEPRGVTVARASALLERFGLLGQAHSWPAELSGGQRQRVAILQQVLCSEYMLLMDEPFSGLDPVMKDKTCALIEEVSQIDDQNTIVIVTHDVEYATLLSDQIILLGRDRTPTGEVCSGAKVQKVIDLKERGVAWRSDRRQLSAFRETVDEILALFPHL